MASSIQRPMATSMLSVGDLPMHAAFIDTSRQLQTRKLLCCTEAVQAKEGPCSTEAVHEPRATAALQRGSARQLLCCKTGSACQRQHLWQNRRRRMRPEVPVGVSVEPAALPSANAACAAASSADSVTSCCVASRYVSCAGAHKSRDWSPAWLSRQYPRRRPPDFTCMHDVWHFDMPTAPQGLKQRLGMRQQFQVLMQRLGTSQWFQVLKPRLGMPQQFQVLNQSLHMPQHCRNPLKKARESVGSDKPARLVQEGVEEDVEQPARRVEPGRDAARVAREEARAAQACAPERAQTLSQTLPGCLDRGLEGKVSCCRLLLVHAGQMRDQWKGPGR